MSTRGKRWTVFACVALIVCAAVATMLALNSELETPDEIESNRCHVPVNSTLVLFTPSVPYFAVEGFLRTAECATSNVSVFESDRIECLQSADVVAFHVRDLVQPLTLVGHAALVEVLHDAAVSGRPPWSHHQAWIALSYEAAAWAAPYLTDSPAATNVFDALFVHETGALLVPHDMSADAVPAFHERERDVLLLVSDCTVGPSDRPSLLPSLIAQARELGLAVDSLGRCWPTPGPPPIELTGRDDANWVDSKAQLLRHFKFELIVANALCDFYVDEKLLLSLRSGAIPVLLGPPNARLFEPDPDNDAIVHVAEYNTTSALLRRLLEIKSSPALQLKYHAWRRLLPTTWPRIATDARPWACRLADWKGRRAAAEPVHCHGQWRQHIQLDWAIEDEDEPEVEAEDEELEN